MVFGGVDFTEQKCRRINKDTLEHVASSGCLANVILGLTWHISTIFDPLKTVTKAVSSSVMWDFFL